MSTTRTLLRSRLCITTLCAMMLVLLTPSTPGFAGAVDQNETMTIQSVPASGSVVRPGDVITYKITAKNGRQVARQLTDLLSRFHFAVPTGTTFESVSFARFQFVVFLNAPEVGDPGYFPFDATTGIFGGQFYPNSTIEFTLTVRVASDASGEITNQAGYSDVDTRTIVSSNIVSHTVEAAATP